MAKTLMFYRIFMQKFSKYLLPIGVVEMQNSRHKSISQHWVWEYIDLIVPKT